MAGTAVPRGRPGETGVRRMSRVVVVSNRVAPIQEGEATAGGLAAGVLDALKQKGGLWFGWSGDVTETSEPKPEHTVGPITLFTINLSRRDYDEFYRGFANGTLWPVLHYQIGLGRFEWPEFEGYRPGSFDTRFTLLKTGQ